MRAPDESAGYMCPIICENRQLKPSVLVAVRSAKRDLHNSSHSRHHLRDFHALLSRFPWRRIISKDWPTANKPGIRKGRISSVHQLALWNVAVWVYGVAQEGLVLMEHPCARRSDTAISLRTQ